MKHQMSLQNIFGKFVSKDALKLRKGQAQEKNSAKRRRIHAAAACCLVILAVFCWTGWQEVKADSNIDGRDHSATTVTNSTSPIAVGEGRLMVSNGASIFVISADPNDQQNSYTVASSFFLNSNQTPSVSTLTGRIAYLSNRRSEGVYLNLVWAMDADGSNPHQVTPPTGLFPGEQDSAPVISPDGTKIAFLSKRFNSPDFPDGTHKGPEVFVVNFDGSGLHQVTQSDQSDNGAPTYATAVAWGGGGNLYVAARRIKTNEMGVRITQSGIFTFGTDGSGGAVDTELSNFTEPAGMDVSGSTILCVIDNKLYVGSHGSFVTILPETAGLPRWGGVGETRFSPDGSRIVYSSDEQGGSLKTIGADGINPGFVRTNLGNTNGKWWIPGAMPTPSRLEMSPAQVFLPNDGTFQQMIATLYDTTNNVIFRAATFDFRCDTTYPCGNGVDGRLFNFYQDGQLQILKVGDTRTGVANFCGTSGGITGCSTIILGLNFAEINASVPTANTNGSGGPGIFTVRRTSAPGQSNTTLDIPFTLGGTAVRGLDYELNVAGKDFLMPSGRTTLDIRVIPLRAMGNKTVIMDIRAQSGATYSTVQGRDAATINIVENGPASTALSLSSLTPDEGGNGGMVFATVYGRNIRPGASLKLSRTGQTDVVGTNVDVADDKTSATAAFDLNNKAEGLWDVVVTNSDLIEARINNGFTVKAYLAARMQINISGPTVIRASHTESQYDVEYTNTGNVDAFGVFILVSGVYLNDHQNGSMPYTSIVTPLKPLVDIPGQAPFPSYVHTMDNIIPDGTLGGGAIPLFIPRVPAGSSRVFSFKLRYIVILPNPPDLVITAAALPALFQASNPSNTSTGFRLSTPDAANSPGFNCLTALLGAALDCAGLLPGGGCLTSGISVAGGIINGAVNSHSAGNRPAGDAAYASAVMGGILTTALTCAGSLTGITQVYAAITCLNSLYSAYNSCIDAIFTLRTRRVGSQDPNEKTGIVGTTVQNYIGRGIPLRYGISFANQATATAPAQDVVVTDQLDTLKVDLTTFTLSQISFGDTVIDVPPGLTSYATEVDLRPTNDLLVSVQADLNQGTGLVTWTFHSLDPFTRQTPTDPLAGFLPPNILGTEGEGKVMFTISPKGDVVFGTEIRNSAHIIFDLNAPIDTNEWLNTIDDSRPISSVQPLASQQTSNTFTVSWSGTDTGSSVRDYTLYVSKNGGAFDPVLVNAVSTNTQFTGDPDSTYAFYTIASDNAGNVEGAKVVGEATTHTPAAPATISGTVTYGNAVSGPAPPRYVSNVLISGAGSPSVSVFTVAPGAGAGTYSLSGFGSGSYTVTPTKTGGANTAISSFDAGRIAQHVAGPPLPHLTGNQLLVADVSNNGTISSFDAGEIANYVVSGSPVGTTGTWKFNPVNRAYASITSSVSGEDYSALLMGEVSGNWTNTGARPIGNRRSAVGSGIEKSIAVNAPNIVTTTGSEVIIPIDVQRAANKGIISYEFDLRYDPLVLQPEAAPVELSGTASSAFSFAVNAEEPGILRVAVYGAWPIDENGLLLNLRFTAVGKSGSISPLTWERILFNEGEPMVSTTDGQVEIF